MKLIKKKNNIGQAEFFGLVIIVFLLSIGLVFMIGLKKTETSENIRSSYIDQSLAQNTINSMLNMRTECKIGRSTGIKLSQLIIDCADTKNIECDNYEDSCTYLNRTISNLFNLTLDKFNKPYYFYITPIDETGINLSNLGCNDNVESEPPGKQPVPTRKGNSLIYLRICKY